MKALWRVSNHCDLAGFGGERTEGRWHTLTRGKRIVYLSEHPALALVETLANLKGNPTLFPDRFQLMKVAVSDAISTSETRHLTEHWREDVAGTRAIGDAWLERADAALLRVPSAPSPESINFLLNPLHPDATALAIEWCKWIRYDKRLFHVQETVPPSPIQ